MNMRRSAAALLGAVGLAVLAGCVNYANHPALPRTMANTSPNLPAVEQVMMAGLEWAAMRYPPPAPAMVEEDEAPSPQMVINLPEGVRGRVYERVAAVVPGAAPLTPEHSHLPIYHIGAIRIRGDRAQVNVFRPIPDVGYTPTGETVYQEVRVELRGGLRPWHVVSWREWTPGSGDVPELNYYTPEPPPMRTGPRVGGIYD
jgi:hypothetical protein